METPCFYSKISDNFAEHWEQGPLRVINHRFLLQTGRQMTFAEYRIHSNGSPNPKMCLRKGPWRKQRQKENYANNSPTRQYFVVGIHGDRTQERAPPLPHLPLTSFLPHPSSNITPYSELCPCRHPWRRYDGASGGMERLFPLPHLCSPHLSLILHVRETLTRILVCVRVRGDENPNLGDFSPCTSVVMEPLTPQNAPCSTVYQKREQPEAFFFLDILQGAYSTASSLKRIMTDRF